MISTRNISNTNPLDPSQILGSYGNQVLNSGNFTIQNTDSSLTFQSDSLSTTSRTSLGLCSSANQYFAGSSVNDFVIKSYKSGGVIRTSDMAVNGNLYVSDTLTTTNLITLSSYTTTDPLIEVGSTNDLYNLNTGIMSRYKPAASTRYVGCLFRPGDATFHFVDQVNALTAVDNIVGDYALVKVGGLTASSLSVGNITQSGSSSLTTGSGLIDLRGHTHIIGGSKVLSFGTSYSNILTGSTYKVLALYDLSVDSTPENNVNYFGLGLSTNTIRYQVPTSACSHVFYQDVNALFTIGGTGNISMNASGSFTSGSGSIALNGDCTLATGKNFTASTTSTTNFGGLLLGSGTGGLQMDGNMNMFFRSGATNASIWQVIPNFGSTLIALANRTVAGEGSITMSAPLILNAQTTQSTATGAGTAFRIVGGTQNDPLGAGTIATECFASITRPTLTATNARTYTTASTLYVDGPPVISTNVTCTNGPYALYVGSGSSRFGEVVLNIGKDVLTTGADWAWQKFNTNTTNNLIRWAFGNFNQETGSGNVGSDFALYRYADAGTFIGKVLSFTRSTGDATFINNINAVGITATGSISQTGTGTLSTGTGAISLNGNTTLASGKTLTVTGTTIVNTGTLTLPTSTDTLVGRATIDTLTNKTFADATDSTKKLVLGLSGITAATTRTWTVPDTSDTFVGKNTTDVLTNKTLTTPSITNPTITSGATITGPVSINASAGTNTTSIASGTTTGLLTLGNSANTINLNGNTILASGQTLTLAGMGTAGIIHNSSAGLLSSSLLVDADISVNTITNGKLATVSSTNNPNYIVSRDSDNAFEFNRISVPGMTANVSRPYNKMSIINVPSMAYNIIDNSTAASGNPGGISVALLGCQNIASANPSVTYQSISTLSVLPPTMITTNGSTALATYAIFAQGLSSFNDVEVRSSLKLPTTNGTATALNYYEEASYTGTFVNAPGGGTPSASKTIKIVRIGKMVTMKIPTFMVQTPATGSTYITSSGFAIPTRFSPATITNYACFPCEIFDNANFLIGKVHIVVGTDVYINVRLSNSNMIDSTYYSFNGDLHVSYICD